MAKYLVYCVVLHKQPCANVNGLSEVDITLTGFNLTALQCLVSEVVVTRFWGLNLNRNPRLNIPQEKGAFG